jgi:hypothetical protein
LKPESVSYETTNAAAALDRILSFSFLSRVTRITILYSKVGEDDQVSTQSIPGKLNRHNQIEQVYKIVRFLKVALIPVVELSNIFPRIVVRENRRHRNWDGCERAPHLCAENQSPSALSIHSRVIGFI